MFIASVLNVYVVEPETKADYLSYYGSWLFIGFTGFLFLFSIVFVHLNRRWLTHKKFMNTWGALVLSGELKTKKPYHYFYLWTFFLRRIVFSYTVVVLKDSPRI